MRLFISFPILRGERKKGQGLNSKWYKLDVTILDSRKRLATVEFGENREMEYVEGTSSSFLPISKQTPNRLASAKLLACCVL